MINVNGDLQRSIIYIINQGQYIINQGKFITLPPLQNYILQH